MSALNKSLDISNSISNNNVIAKWITVNLEYLPQVVPITKQFFKLVVPANQVRFTILTKHNACKLDSTIAVTGISFVGANIIGSGDTIRVVTIVGASIILVLVIGGNFDSNNSMGSRMKVATSGNLENAIVCLSI